MFMGILILFRAGHLSCCKGRNMQSGHAGNDHIIPAGTIGTFSMYTVLYRWMEQAELPEARISETNLSGTGLFLPGSTVFARSKKSRRGDFRKPVEA